MISKLASVCSLLAIANSVLAETPAGFTPEVDANLPIAFGGANITPAGEKIPQAEAAMAPVLSQPAGQANTGVVVMMDIDIDQGTGTRTTLLHWLAYNIDLTAVPNKVPDNNGAPYWAPSPPAGDIAHNYVVVLYSQPDNFALPAQYTDFSTVANRQGFNLATFATDSGLTMPLAANYVQIQNGTATAAATSAATSAVSQTVPATSVTAAVTSAKSSTTATSHGAAPTQFGMEWGLLAGAGLLAAIV